MINVNHTPSRHCENSYTIIGDSVDEIIQECLNRIRPQSRAFYNRVLLSDLSNRGRSLIDRHAGMGNFYTVCYEKRFKPL